VDTARLTERACYNSTYQTYPQVRLRSPVLRAVLLLLGFCCVWSSQASWLGTVVYRSGGGSHSTGYLAVVSVSLGVVQAGLMGMRNVLPQYGLCKW
jgi:hypothetical protein